MTKARKTAQTAPHLLDKEQVGCIVVPNEGKAEGPAARFSQTTSPFSGLRYVSPAVWERSKPARPVFQFRIPFAAALDGGQYTPEKREDEQDRIDCNRGDAASLTGFEADSQILRRGPERLRRPIRLREIPPVGKQKQENQNNGNGEQIITNTSQNAGLCL